MSTNRTLILLTAGVMLVATSAVVAGQPTRLELAINELSAGRPPAPPEEAVVLTGIRPVSSVPADAKSLPPENYLDRVRVGSIAEDETKPTEEQELCRESDGKLTTTFVDAPSGRVLTGGFLHADPRLGLSERPFLTVIHGGVPADARIELASSNGYELKRVVAISAQSIYFTALSKRDGGAEVLVATDYTVSTP